MAIFIEENYMQPSTTSAQALQQLQGFQASEQSPDQILNSQESTLGVPQEQQQVSGLRQAITNTTNLLNQVAPSVYGRTENSLVTDAQATRQIGNESAPIQSKLAGLNTSEGNAASDLNTNLSRAGTLASLQAQGQTSKEASLKDIYSALYGQEQDAQAEADKQRQLADSEKPSSSGSGGLSASDILKQNQASQQAQDVNGAKADLDKLVGKDGYVSPQTYAAVAKQWVAAGYSLKDFSNYFAQYKNPQNPYYSI